MTECVWLLDVDGVLNANKAGWSRAPRKGYVYANNDSWTIRWEPELMFEITRLHMSGMVRILWATTWVGNTQQLE